MRYIRGTRKMLLILSANISGIPKWWIDASYAVHPNMSGHSGGGLSLGQGFTIVSSTKQKLNTRSSTDTELVGVDNFMPEICWIRYFTKVQGYGVKDNVLFQNKKSSILLEKNGKASISKHKAHQHSVFLHYQPSYQGRSAVGMVTYRGHDWRLRDQATPRGSIQKV
jgi:hypothetical protein